MGLKRKKIKRDKNTAPLTVKREENMDKLFYLDTSIWLDFLEDRNKPNMPKSEWAKELIKKIIIEGFE